MEKLLHLIMLGNNTKSEICLLYADFYDKVIIRKERWRSDYHDPDAFFVPIRSRQVYSAFRYWNKETYVRNA